MDGAATLRKDLPPSREEVRELTEELTRANAKAAQAVGRSERLTEALQEAREQITALKEEVDKLCAPPSTYGVYLSVNEDGTVNILAQGRKVKVNL
ncbi:MAG TPA: proteasome ATPase, partial [Patescibacteria group bacterium]|nr:proteasome ATPase [Patescibacteria group bacterium]